MDNPGPQSETAVKKYIRSSLEEAFSELMKMELSSFLEYEPYERTDSEDARNEEREDIQHLVRYLSLLVPGDRLGIFQSTITSKFAEHDFLS